ncbi:MAG: HPr family phosphocarrier protein [Lachnospiraceae bacterium]|nr:HPr family phosphocarrier protein [Lachnospiraceae bacterium]
MQSAFVLLNSIDKVKNFVNTVSRFDSDIDMRSGRFTIDGKSIMGIFSLDLARPIEVVIYNDEEVPAVLEALTPFKVEVE